MPKHTQYRDSTAIGAAIHGAVAYGLVPDFGAGAARFGAKSSKSYEADLKAFAVYSSIFRHFQALSHDPKILAAMDCLAALQAVEVWSQTSAMVR